MIIALIYSEDVMYTKVRELWQKELEDTGLQDSRLLRFKAPEEFLEQGTADTDAIFVGIPLEREVLVGFTKQVLEKCPNAQLRTEGQPLTQEALHGLIKQIMDRKPRTRDLKMRLTDGHRIAVMDIYYVRHVSGRCIAYGAGGEAFICYLPLASELYMLELYREFFAVNPSTQVNLWQIDQVLRSGQLLKMKNGHYINVIKSRQKELRQRYRELHYGLRMTKPVEVYISN